MTCVPGDDSTARLLATTVKMPCASIFLLHHEHRAPGFAEYVPLERNSNNLIYAQIHIPIPSHTQIAYPTTNKMCAVAHFRDPRCKHHWAKITQPCVTGADFSTCPLIFNKFYVLPEPKVYLAVSQQCPICDLGGVYDRNLVRMVLSTRKGMCSVGGEGRL